MGKDEGKHKDPSPNNGNKGTPRPEQRIMGSTVSRQVTPDQLSQRLADALGDRLPPVWREAYRAVPRHLFVVPGAPGCLGRRRGRPGRPTRRDGWRQPTRRTSSSPSGTSVAGPAPPARCPTWSSRCWTSWIRSLVSGCWRSAPEQGGTLPCWRTDSAMTRCVYRLWPLSVVAGLGRRAVGRTYPR